MANDPVLHQLVWDDCPADLQAVLSKAAERPLGHETPSKAGAALPFVDQLFRGITALGLACQLGRRECVVVLLEHGASCFVSSELGFLPFQEANAYGDRALLQLLFTARQAQLREQWAKRQAQLHQVLCMVELWQRGVLTVV